MKYIFMLIGIIFFSTRLMAQHQHNTATPDTTKKPAKKTITKRNMKNMNMRKMGNNKNMNMDSGMSRYINMDTMMNMGSHAFSKNLLMNRNGSGTSWMPDKSPMYMYMTGNKTLWMFHGNIFLRYTNQDIFNKGSRGGSALDAPNWFMAMMQKKIGQKGLLMSRIMISLDPLTEGRNGYPLLFQSGETYKGKPLVDNQHPHDLFSELSVGYTFELNKNADIFSYLAYPGEPALSAPAFMHRISAMSNPDAPLGHHWQDATHITFGVATLGFRYKNFKIDGSVFNGHEPGENRYNLDKLYLNSYSYRLSFNPSPYWALQFSQGFIESPESLEPGVDVTRTTASVLFSKKISDKNQYDAALIWGYNDKSDDHKEHSVLLEDNHRFSKNTIYSRYEFVQKSSEELNLETGFGDVKFKVHAFTGGYNRLFFAAKYFDLLGGLQATINFPDKRLKSLYGKTPISGEIYLQIKPQRHKHFQ